MRAWTIAAWPNADGHAKRIVEAGFEQRPAAARELRDESPRGDEAIALHEVRLQGRESGVPIGECGVRVTQLGEPCHEGAPHVRERRRHLVYFADTG